MDHVLRCGRARSLRPASDTPGTRLMTKTNRQRRSKRTLSSRVFATAPYIVRTKNTACNVSKCKNEAFRYRCNRAHACLSLARGIDAIETNVDDELPCPARTLAGNESMERKTVVFRIHFKFLFHKVSIRKIQIDAFNSNCPEHSASDFAEFKFDNNLVSDENPNLSGTLFAPLS